MNIRPATLVDAAAIAKVHVDSWRTTYRGILPAEFLAGLSYERREQIWRNSLGNSEREFTYVAEAEPGQIVGFITGGPEREGDPTYAGELIAIYLLAEQQGKGIGRQLVGRLAQSLLARQLTTLLVWVLAANPARTFYQKLGGQYIKEKPITFGGAEVIEEAYGWLNLSPLAQYAQPARLVGR